MNFLSHYYFDKREGYPYFNLGLIFPDILRNFVKGSKLDLTIEFTEAPLLDALQKGCIQHVQSDKVFHAWQGFHDAMDFVTEQIRKHPIEIKKDWFIAHILVELTIDHFLLRQHPNLATMLYTDFELVDTKQIHSFLHRNHFSNFDLFQKGFDRFMKVRYLESYTEPDNIVYALGRICTKMRLPPFSDEQKHLLVSIVHALNIKMPTMIEDLKVELK